MASFTRTDMPGFTYLYVWELTTADTDGDEVSLPGAADKTVQFDGTWGGATAVFEGSNEATSPATFLSLTDPQGNAISKTDDGIEAVTENPVWVRPRLSTAGTDASVTVRLLVRSTM